MAKRVNGFTYSELVDISMSLKSKQIEYLYLAASETCVSKDYYAIARRYSYLREKITDLICEFRKGGK